MAKVTSSEKDQEIEAKKTQEVQKAASTRALSPLEEMELVFDRIERLFGGLMPRNWLRAQREWPSWQELTAPFEGWLPRVDVIEHDQEVVVRAELPGVDKKAKVRFTSGQITAHVLETVLPVHGDRGEVIVLDPPRMGVEKGVIGAIAFRKPAWVLHIFCNVDLLPVELEQWKRLGYHATSIIPLDMFPGTVHLEVLVLLEPRQAGK